MEFHIILRAQPGYQDEVVTRLQQMGFASVVHGGRIKILGTDELTSLQLHCMALVMSKEQLLKDVQITNTYSIGGEEQHAGE